MAITIDQATKVKELTVASQTAEGKPSTLVLTDTSLYVNGSSSRECCTWPMFLEVRVLDERPSISLAKRPEILVPLRHVLWAESKDEKFEVSLLAGKAGPLKLLHISGKVEAAQQEEADAFVQAVLDTAYRG